MKNTKKAVLKTILSIFLFITYSPIYAQTGIVSGGNSVCIPNEGSISCTIGQVNYLYANSSEGSLQEGIQQAEKCSTNVHVQENEKITLKISPNPTKDYCTIQLQDNEKYHYKLTTIEGKILDNGTLQNGTTLQLTNYINGVYFLQITRNESEIQTYRIIKE